MGEKASKQKTPAPAPSRVADDESPLTTPRGPDDDRDGVRRAEREGGEPAAVCAFAHLAELAATKAASSAPEGGRCPDVVLVLQLLVGGTLRVAGVTPSSGVAAYPFHRLVVVDSVFPPTNDSDGESLFRRVNGGKASGAAPQWTPPCAHPYRLRSIELPATRAARDFAPIVRDAAPHLRRLTFVFSPPQLGAKWNRKVDGANVMAHVEAVTGVAKAPPADGNAAAAAALFPNLERLGLLAPTGTFTWKDDAWGGGRMATRTTYIEIGADSKDELRALEALVAHAPRLQVVGTRNVIISLPETYSQKPWEPRAGVALRPLGGGPGSDELRKVIESVHRTQCMMDVS